MKLILASASPRRRELLRLVVPEFEVIPADCEERPIAGAPSFVVRALAEQKAKNVAARFPGRTVLAADTLVFLGNEPLGKPADAKDAARMLRALSGREHEVMTGLALIKGGVLKTDFCSTRVFFAHMSERETADYVASGDPMDKAGAYGIQSGAARFITGIEGCFFNVMGLPVRRVYELLV